MNSYEILLVNEKEKTLKVRLEAEDLEAAYRRAEKNFGDFGEIKKITKLNKKGMPEEVQEF